MAIEVKRLYQPSQQPEETRRKNAIRKTYRYEGVPFGDPVKLAGFRAKLINMAISYEQTQTRTGIGRTGLQSLTEACETGMWANETGHIGKYLKRVKEHFKNIFGFTDDDFTCKTYCYNEFTTFLEEVS